MKMNIMCDVAFTVIADIKPEDIGPVCDDAEIERVGADIILSALQRRLEWLRQNPNDIAEAIGVCDSYREEECEPNH